MCVCLCLCVCVHACVHACMSVRVLHLTFNSQFKSVNLMHLCTLTGYILHTHAMMVSLTQSFCKLFHVILLNYIRFKFLYINKIKILPHKKCYKHVHFDS